MDVYFWQNMPSHIQSPAIVELAKIWPGNVHCVWETPISADRSALSWTPPDLPGISQQFIDRQQPAEFAKRVIFSAREQIHIFSGLSSYPAITAAFRYASRIGAGKLGLMVEPGIRIGWRGWLRPYRARLIATSHYRSIRLVLAMGQTGVRFYRHAGFAQQIIFPYMYQGPVGSDQPRKDSSGTFNLIYVGKFDRRKGLDLLLRALTLCRTKGIKLRIIGAGKQERELRELSHRLKLDGSLCWEGVRDHREIMVSLGEADLCVVPSRFEGWGVVVNEAIGMGTPVICSSATTARDLVEYGNCGAVFTSGDANDLAERIDQILQTGGALAAAREHASRYRRQIAAPVVARYLMQVLEFAFLGAARRPSPPWQQSIDAR